MTKLFTAALIAGATVLSFGSVAHAGERHITPRQMEKLMARDTPCTNVHVPVINEKLAKATFTCKARQVAFKASVKIEQLPKDPSFPSKMVFMRPTRLNFLTSLFGWKGGYGEVKATDGHIYATTVYTKVLAAS